MARKFRFRLGMLLRVRRLHEREAKRKVALKQAEVARIDGLIAGGHETVAIELAALRDQQRQPRLDVRAAARRRAWIGQIRGTMLQFHTMLDVAHRELSEAIGLLNAARTQTRIVEKLRERRWEGYVKDRERTDDAEMEEVARQLLHRAGTPSSAASECGPRSGSDDRKSW